MDPVCANFSLRSKCQRDDDNKIMSDILNDLYQTLLERKAASGETSYVASLYAKGTTHIGDKVLEEAREAVEEALAGDRERLREETADLLFHTLVMLADQGVTPEQVLETLRGRMGTSGHVEKANRDRS